MIYYEGLLLINTLYAVTRSSRRSDAICDWLDVTCSPKDSFVHSLASWLGLHCIDCGSFKDGSSTYFLGRGVLKVSSSGRFHRASASGVFIAELRDRSLWRDYVNLLGSVAHKVTRLDVAVDVDVDAPLVLSALCSVYPDGSFSFGRKSMRTKTFFERRETDNALTGTWYAGHRSAARLCGRVYDKQLELFTKQGMLSPPLTRFELTFRKDFGASLWDVLSPTDIFYSHAGNLMDTKLVEYDDWASRGLMPWVSAPVDTDFTVERARRALSHSVEIRRYADLFARQFGAEGEAILAKCLTDALHSALADIAPTPTAGVSVA